MNPIKLLAVALLLDLSGCAVAPPLTAMAPNFSETLVCHLDAATVPAAWECSALPERLLMIEERTP
jgi:hypothetical protein